MSQSRPSNSTATAHMDASPDADTLVEAYAEDLMDDIFQDVDRILAGDDSAIYAETVEQPVPDTSVFRADAVTIPAMIVPLTTERAVGAAAAPIIETDGTQTDGQSSSPDKSSQKRSWGRWFLGIVSLSALAALGFWGMRQQPWLQTTGAPAAPTAPTVSEEIAFGEYLKRSLRIISGDRSVQTEDQDSEAVATAPVEPSVSQSTDGKPGGVIERVFVPLLQPGTARTNPSSTNPSSARGALPPIAAAPSLPAPNNPTSAAQPSEQSAEQPSGAATPVPNIAAANTYELVGVLELGERSAALFDINGSSRRVYIGETIGGSGWSIVSIDNEEVVVRRNGEVRSIYIGQRF